MFKNFFILGIVSAIASTIACFAYTSLYYSKIVDFSEANGIVMLASGCFLVAMIAVVLNVVSRIVLKKVALADFAFNLIFSLVSIAFVFIVLGANDPDFKTENAQLFAEFYKGFVMPMLFFPILTWFTFKPLIIKS